MKIPRRGTAEHCNFELSGLCYNADLDDRVF